MKMLVIALGALAASTHVAGAQDGTVETHIRNGGNSATIIQSGEPKAAKLRVEQRPGYVRIEQHSHNNSATVIQVAPGASDAENAPRP